MQWTIHKQIVVPIVCLHMSILMMYYKIIPVLEQFSQFSSQF